MIDGVNVGSRFRESEQYPLNCSILGLNCKKELDYWPLAGLLAVHYSVDNYQP